MPRRRVVAKREVLPDPKFGNVTLAKFMNHVMVSGKKSVAETIVYGALDIVRERLNKDPIEAFDEALENIAPMVEVKARRVGGATYQVPVEVRPSRRIALSMRCALWHRNWALPFIMGRRLRKFCTAPAAWWVSGSLVRRSAPITRSATGTWSPLPIRLLTGLKNAVAA